MIEDPRVPKTPKQIRDTEKRLEMTSKNDREARVLLGLINAIFQSDPLSVQCFDRRIVDRVQYCVLERECIREKYGLFDSI